MAKILYLYASREGQTQRICECMAQEARRNQHEAELMPFDDARVERALAQCEHVVLGASVHYGHLPKAFYHFIRAKQTVLESKKNGFFCVNLTARKAGKDTPDGSAYMQKFLRISTWRPQKLTVFAGALLYTHYTWYDKMMIRFIMYITGGPTDTRTNVEFTDWEKVRQCGRDWLN